MLIGCGSDPKPVPESSAKEKAGPLDPTLSPNGQARLPWEFPRNSTPREPRPTDWFADITDAAIVRFDLGRDDEVLEHCRELTELAPEDPHPWYVMAMVQRNRGYWDHFVDAARKAVALSREKASDLRLELVDAYIHLG